MDFLQAIRERRERAVQRALTMLDTYADADAATRPTLLQVAGKSLADARVADRWIATLANEPDQGLRQLLLRWLSALDFRQIPSSANCTAQLLACLNQPDAREWALYCIARIAPHDPQLAAPLMAAYRTQRNETFAKRILAVLIGIAHPPVEVFDFFVSIFDDVNEDTKNVIVHRLLERDLVPESLIAKLLAPTEPSCVKILTLDHLVDRSLRCDVAALDLLKRDSDPAVRYAALWALTETGEPSQAVLDALLTAASSDPDMRVREFAIGAFEHTLAKTPAVLASLLDAQRSETSIERAQLLLRLLTPYTSRDPQILASLTQLLERNLNTELALEIYAAIAPHAASNADVQEWLIAAYAREKEDRVRAAILKTLSKSNPDDPRVARLCVEALTLPEPEIQQWGVQGVLLLQQRPENEAALIAASKLLLSPDIPLSLREELAHKLAVLPEKSPELLESLRATAAQSRDFRLRQICEAAANDALSAKLDATEGAASGIDWNEWLHRAELEHRADGIFPAIGEHFDESPEIAKKILKALLNPQCSDSLYSCYGYDVSESSILDLLDRKNALDDDTSRHCIGRVLTKDVGSPGVYLQFLAANPAFAGLKDNLWSIVEKCTSADAALLRELLVSAYGDEDAAAQAFMKRVGAIRGAAALKPYLRVLIENAGWPPAKEMLIEFLQHADLNAASRKEIASALKTMGVEPQSAPVESPAKAGPGFADD